MLGELIYTSAEKCEGKKEVGDMGEAVSEKAAKLLEEIGVLRRKTDVVKGQARRMRRTEMGQSLRMRQHSQLSWQLAVVAECPRLGRHPSDEELFHELVSDDPKDYKDRKAYIFKLDYGTRTQFFYPNSGLCSEADLEPNTFVALHPASHCPIRVLPREYDVRARSLEVEERPNVCSADLGGLDAQIKELNEVVLSLNRPEVFAEIGITPPKGILLYGPPGTGKTLLARMVASQTKATFLRLSSTALVQMYIGEGAKIVRDAFQVARDKAPSVIFIDEIDSIGKKRSGDDADHIGNREISRTLMELLNQLDGFQPSSNVKVIAATNRVDVLDPALVRSGRLDRKVEIPEPDTAARAEILRIHSRRLCLAEDIDWDELAAESEGFSAAAVRAISLEAAMAAIASNAKLVDQSHFAAALRLLKQRLNIPPNYFA